MNQRDFRVENGFNIGDTIGQHNKFECDARGNSEDVGTLNIRASGLNWLPLFIVNHFHESPEEIHSLFDNSFDQLIKRYKTYCHSISNSKLPNFLAIDFYNRNRKNILNFLTFMMKGGIILFEGNNGGQDALCSIPIYKDEIYNLQNVFTLQCHCCISCCN